MAADTIAPDSLSLTPEQVTQILEAHYRLRATRFIALQSELSAVYRVELHSGRTVAFKAIRYRQEDAVLTAWQTSAMERLNERGLPAPATIRTEEGELLALAETEEGQVIAHIGEWLDGTPLEAVQTTPELMHSVGVSGAQIALALSEVSRPAIQRDHPWALSRTLESIRESLVAIEDQQTVSLLQQAVERFEKVVQPVLHELPHTVVHHDLHDSNLLVNERRDRVNGVLDFGDMVWAPRIAEIAVIAAYACRGAAEPAQAYLSVAEGWGTVMPLTAEEVAVLLAASIGRLAVNLAVWSARSGSDRGEYARARSRTTVRGLVALLGVDEARFTELLMTRLCAPRIG
ncbi:phosphotransferase [Leucobacter sp. UT-8R-CII-1-4]|uniref:phosphotransferase n=1 Tax=Leucobacter sp. UT-8R-CII-1-4 TaxID=3040075 RepID=UPI0024A7A60A|nr:phosphotransferase [Leucobacter sp. UT-8R-CII-1-4]MDI6023098.1 phosphotransferase [Leucobacter sp. UT-8R-CII-1-4]